MNIDYLKQYVFFDKKLTKLPKVPQREDACAVKFFLPIFVIRRNDKSEWEAVFKVLLLPGVIIGKADLPAKVAALDRVWRDSSEIKYLQDGKFFGSDEDRKGIGDEKVEEGVWGAVQDPKFLKKVRKELESRLEKIFGVSPLFELPKKFRSEIKPLFPENFKT